MAGPGPDKDVHISLEDQQKINKFARHNQRLEDIKDDMKQKEAELVTLGDASNDVEEFSLTSEDGTSSIFKLSAATQSWLSEFDTQHSGLSRLH